MSLLLVMLPDVCGAATANVPKEFAPIAFLIGDWSGDGKADAGPGTGTDTFRLDLGDRVVVRRSHSFYPSVDGKPSTTYDAMMIVYDDSAGKGLRADYFDNGGHVIRYALVANTAADVAQFVSDAVPGAPTFRLTYTGAPDGNSYAIKFELAPPGSADFTTTIAEGTAKRVR